MTVPATTRSDIGDGTGDSPAPSAEDRFAVSLRRRGLAAPALLWGAALRPLSFVGGQTLRLAAPLWSLFDDGDGLQDAVDVLEDRRRFDRFLDLLENGEAAP